jgi:hypothetical protein
LGKQSFLFTKGGNGILLSSWRETRTGIEARRNFLDQAGFNVGR